MKKVSLILVLILLFTVIVPLGTAHAQYEPDFDVKPEGVLLVNLDHDEGGQDTIVYEKNADEKLYPASLTKIMTAIVALEHIEDLDQTIEIPADPIYALRGTGSSLTGIEVGEQLSYRQLISAMLVQSGNDAANVLAYVIGGGDIATFIDMMNTRATELGCTNTHFVNPHGLHDENHYTTPRDMYILTKHALTLPMFAETCAKTRYELPDNSRGEKRILSTTNLLMETGKTKRYYYAPVSGVKTGFTDQAGRCVISTASQDGYNYLLVIMNAPVYDENKNVIGENISFTSSKSLYKWAFDTFKLKALVSQDTPVDEVKLKLAWEKDNLLVQPASNFTALVPKEIEPSSVMLDYHLPDHVNAPVEKGDVICTANVMLAGEKIGEVNIVASETVGRSQLLFIGSMLQKAVSSIWFKIIVGAILLLVVAYVIICILYNQKKKRLKKVKATRRF